MHAVSTLEKSSEGGVWEVVLHFEKMDEFGHSAAFFNHLFEIEVRVLNELVDCFLVSEDTILVRFRVLKHTKVGFTRHQKSLLDNVDKTESEEVERNVHEIRCGERHQSKNADLVTDNL